MSFYQTDNAAHQLFTGTYKATVDSVYTKNDSNSLSSSSASTIYKDNKETISENNGESYHGNVKSILKSLSAVLISIFLL